MSNGENNIDAKKTYSVIYQACENSASDRWDNIDVDSEIFDDINIATASVRDDIEYINGEGTPIESEYRALVLDEKNMEVCSIEWKVDPVYLTQSPPAN